MAYKTSMKRKRDEFDAKSINILAKRAAYICSNPGCRAFTISPSETDSEKHISLGKASHITAAARNDPRYDSSLTPEQRRSLENGIYLCSSCTDLIDRNNGIDFSVEQLSKWKTEHEAWVRSNLNKSVASLTGSQRQPILNVCFDAGRNHIELIKKLYVEPDNDHIKFKLGETIIRLDIQIANDGDSPANDIDGYLDVEGFFHIFNRKQLRNYWDIYPHSMFDDPEGYREFINQRQRETAEQFFIRGVADGFGFSVFEDLIPSQSIKNKNVLMPPIRASINSNKITFHTKKLKQNQTRVIEPLYIDFYSWDEIASFNIVYRLNAEELTSDVQGILRVEIQKEPERYPIKKSKTKTGAKRRVDKR